MFPSTCLTPALAAACAGLFFLSASDGSPDQGRTPRMTVARPVSETAAVKQVESTVRAASSVREPAAVAQGEELSVDDGSADGRGLLEDGLTVAVRLTPAAYPVKLTGIRIYFVLFNNAPDPKGQTIRLVAFTGTSPRPPAGVSYLVDQRVQVSQAGGFVDFPIANGPTITSGDLWVGYQAPSPAAGVGFATDTDGPQSDRTYWLDAGSSNWGGPLRFTDGVKANAMIRARVTTLASPSGDFELQTDDGSIDGGLLRDGGMYVNRLTPPGYPARLKSIRIFVPQMTDQPSPEGKTVRVIAFQDPTGAGRPPDNSTFAVNRAVRLGKPGEFQDVPVEGPVVAAGDLYVGFQAPDPHTGVAFAVDTTGQPFQRLFRSYDGGSTFVGPVALMGDGGQTMPVNLMVRAVVRLGATDPEAGFTVQTSAAELDLSESGSERVEAAVRGPDPLRTYTVRARFDPPAPELTVTPGEQQARSMERLTFQVASREAGDRLSAPLVIEATDGESTVRGTVTVNLWREVAAAPIGPLGGRVECPLVSVAIPAAAWSETRAIKVYTGKPVMGREDELASPVYRVEGLPEGYNGGLQIRLPLGSAQPATGAVRLAGASDGLVGVLQFSLPDPEGKTVPMQVFQPAKVESGSVVLDCPAKKAKVTNRFSFWMLSGWYTMESAEGNFLVFYPIGARDHAIWAAERLEQALLGLQSRDVDIRLLDRISYVSTLGNLGFTTHPIRATLDSKLTANGVTRAGQIYLDLKRLKQDPADVRSTPGHELMHIAQNLYGDAQGSLDFWMGRADPTVWGDDALASWFEPLAIGEPNFVPDVMLAGAREFCLAGPLQVPGYYAGDRDYGYGAANFLTYVHRFVDRTVPAKWLAQRAPDREPWALLVPLIGGHTAMAKHWRDFGEKLFQQELIPGATYPNPVYFMPLEDAGKFDFMKTGEREDKKWRQAHDLSMQFYSFLMPEGVPNLTDSTVLGFQILEKYPDADIYLLGLKTGKPYAMQRGAGELAIEAKSVEAEPGLLVAVVNYSYDSSPSIRSRRDLTVRMGLADPTVKIQGGWTIGERVIGATYDFNTTNRNIPAEATYTWNFGDKSATGRAVKTSWSAAGTYKVRVEASFSRQTVSDEVTVVVAPDKPEPAKAEVLFEVFRRLKTTIGTQVSTSNQMCNDYAITIADPTGVVVDGGSSVARNGAFETRLPVGNGYSYRVRYTYTTPCPDSGNVSGRFDVKAGITGVRIETPPCER